MAASNEWTEWHLTPRGWKSGSELVDVGNLTAKDPPFDRVLTVKYRESVSSMYSTTDRSSEEIWRGADEAEVAQLLATLGPAPRCL